LTGFDAMRALAADDGIGLPLMSHPALLSLHLQGSPSGMAPEAQFGLLPRLAGADVSIYPSYGTGYAMARADCAAVADACRQPWGSVASMFPTAAGRMGLAQVPELCELYGRDVLFILGSAIQSHPKGATAACEEILRAVTEQTASWPSPAWSQTRHTRGDL
jgi:ribulose-bisphosphate carboxylase large chain